MVYSFGFSWPLTAGKHKDQTDWHRGNASRKGFKHRRWQAETHQDKSQETMKRHFLACQRVSLLFLMNTGKKRQQLLGLKWTDGGHKLTCALWDSLDLSAERPVPKMVLSLACVLSILKLFAAKNCDWLTKKNFIIQIKTKDVSHMLTMTM